MENTQKLIKYGGNLGNGCLLWWLAETESYSDTLVCVIDGEDTMLDSNNYTTTVHYGVRPVLEISKDRIE